MAGRLHLPGLFHPALALLASVLMADGSAPEARWVALAIEVEGGSESAACARARAQAAAKARAHLGLNLGVCRCRPAPPQAGRDAAGHICRITYELLVRQRSR